MCVQVVEFNDSAIEMAKNLVNDSICKSANLEGFNTDIETVKAVLENLPVNSTRDEMLFIINMKNAWDFLLDNIDYDNNIMFVRQLNKLVGSNLFYGNGEIRTLMVKIGGTKWTPDIPIEGLVIDTLSDINTIEDVELRALKMFCFIARAQIFIDGNKRVAQLMANKVLIQSNIGIFQVPIECLDDFRTLLLRFYETNNDISLIDFMKKCCISRVIKGKVRRQG